MSSTSRVRSQVVALLNKMEPIGHIKSWFKTKNGTPRQPTICSLSRGVLNIDKSVFNNPEHSLAGIEEFSHIWIIFVFDRNDGRHLRAKVKPPRLNGKRVGVFATRSPHRPNPIGLTLAKLDRVEGATLHLSGLDILDGTTVLDVKPYVPEYDRPGSVPESRRDNGAGDDKPRDNALPANSDAAADPRPEAQQVALGKEVVRRVQWKSPVVDSECSQSIEASDILDHSCSFDSHTIVVHATPGDARQRAATAEDGEGATDAASPEERSPEGAPANRSRGRDDRGSDEETRVSNRGGVDDGGGSPPSRTDAHVRDTGTTPVEGTLVSAREASVADATGDATQETQPRNLAAMTATTSTTMTMAAMTTAQVADWLADPPVRPLRVRFTERAREQLLRYFSPGALGSSSSSLLRHLRSHEELRASIAEILSADPRSVYRRQKCSDRLYYLTVDAAHVTCWFDDDGSVEVIKVRPDGEVSGGAT
ncbi:PREDICTED: nef-associated protein 1-like [Priapulus caudatus]|uniref:Nef-associated protein 1-like n=1 Tax=Priapulus caudatus TaxID=37621 RepID=A0ABM1EBW4_PRICU|nr:PREDICTED: nef-associated protein 1-like [Priapulus caudatus]XP_014669686.1 PREDICTED: nef-associated protein 1-like [Priapulus caudatus]